MKMEFKYGGDYNLQIIDIMIKRIAFHLIYCFAIAYTLCGTELSAQVRLSSDSISSLFLDYYEKMPQEKVYVHTDRDCYVAGDTVWFRTYIVDAATNRLSDRSKFVYHELLDNVTDTLITRIKVKADSMGVFANAIPLSSRMKSGNYTLAAYTQWMQNFDNDLFFKKVIRIINQSDSIKTKRIPRKLEEIGLSIMPEGGNLIAGHPQRVAYKVVGDDGRGVDVIVRLVNASGDVLKEGVSQHLGMGYVLVTADANDELWIEAVSADGLLCREKLPKALISGATLSVNQHKGVILIQPYNTPDKDIRQMALVLYGAGNLMALELFDTNPIKVNSQALKPGVVNIALIDRVSLEPLAERLIFVRSKNREDLRLKISKIQGDTP